MSEDLQKAKDEMLEAGYRCVLRKGEVRLISTERGVKPLLSWIDEGLDLSGYAAADQVVGKAAALLYVLMGVKEIYTRVLSEQAARVFEKNGISFEAGERVPYIINRAGTGRCPMESAVWETDDPEEAYRILKAK